MQNHTKDVLASIVNGGHMCTLCLKIIDGEPFDVYDEVFLEDDSSIPGLLFTDILSSILVLDVSSYRFLYNSVVTLQLTVMIKIILCFFQEYSSFILNKMCKACVSSAIASYRFMKMCLNSRQILANIVANVSSCLCNIEADKSKTLYITTDVNNGECRTYYDKCCSADNATVALKRLKIITKKRKVKKKVKMDTADSPINDFPDLASNYDGDSDSNNRSVCGCCSRKFLDSKNLKAHFLRVHAPKNFKCNKCPRKYGAAYLLKHHKSKSHITVICAECGKTYNNTHSLYMHSFTHAKLMCPLCKRTYKTRNSYKKHVKSKICTKERSYRQLNNVEQKYICDVCSKGYAQKSSLQVHIKFKHGNSETFCCNWCEKKFPAQSRLKAHIVKHTRERNFTCEVCGGKFVSKAALIYHTRIHTGETPYSCTECDQKFLSASRRMDHIRRKHMRPTMECDVCNNKFRTSQALKKHKRLHFNPNSRLYMQSLENT